MRIIADTTKIGGALKLLPVLTQTKDKTQITPPASSAAGMRQ